MAQDSRFERSGVPDVPAKIEIRGLGRTFKKRGTNEPFHALSGFNLTVQAGEFVTVVGPSGCGKSTLLDILVGLAKADEGQILIDGKPISAPSLDRGIVLQGYALFPWRSVRKNIEFGLEIKRTPKRERAEIVAHFIKLVGLEGFENHYPYELSGGMQQRVAIARALAYDPEALFMDEPFAAVDAQTRETMQDELLSIWEKTNKTVIFVTHSIEEAVGLADRVAVVSKSPGRIKEVIDVGLPRPRRVSQVRDTTDFNIITHRVRELLQDKEPVRAREITSTVNVSEAIAEEAMI
ncbi:MAG: ABC transporter ATP-binding protein [Oscillospiraceae bacterium]|jgi:NitT/TauT family transport system ATP-binding protein|nr:ABC transporter ATP-binding protein [Oscillospiraceae bacterium]